MIEFPFIGGSYPAEAKPFSSQRTVNLFAELDPNYRTKAVLEGFPGHKKWTQAGNGPIRGGVEFQGRLVVVSGNTVYRITKGGFASSIGSIATSSGLVSMDENGAQVMLVDGKDGYVYDGATFTKITDPVFTATKADQVTHMDSFFVVNEPGTGRIWVSDSFDGLNWSATRTATAEFKSDEVIALKADRELFLGGAKTIQAYYNSGASPMPFEALRSSRLIYGVAARDSWAVVGNTSYFLSKDGNGAIFVGRLNGPSVERVSVRAWEKEWAKYDFSTAYAFGVHFHGHEWYVLTFPDADHVFGRTFLYSIATGVWSEIGVYQPSVGDFGAHPMTFHAWFSNRNLIGDINGWLHELDDETYTFDGETMIALRRSPVLHDKMESFSLNRLSVGVEVGVENADSTDPQIHMRHSKNGGYTWKNTRYKSLTGTYSDKYKTSIDFPLMGMARDWVFEVSISDPVRRRFFGGFVS